MISFRTQRILEKIISQDFISVATIMEIFDKDQYLPKNFSDAYGELKILVEANFIKKVKKGTYQVNKKLVEKALGEVE